MSGGSWNYFYEKLSDVALRLRCEHGNPLRIALGVKLSQAAEALHDIEWNDSGDGSDTEEKNIAKVLGKEATQMVAEAAIDSINAAIENANKAITTIRTYR